MNQFQTTLKGTLAEIGKNVPGISCTREVADGQTCCNRSEAARNETGNELLRCNQYASENGNYLLFIANTVKSRFVPEKDGVSHDGRRRINLTLK